MAAAEDHALSRRAAMASVVPGLVVGLVGVVLAASIASLIYESAGQEALDRGIGFAIVGSAISMAWLGWRSGQTGIMGGPQASVAAVVAVVVAGGAAASSQGDEVVTVFAIVAVSTLFIGLVFSIAGTLRLAQLVRYIPFPVVGGFLAGTGWLIARGALNVMVGSQVGWDEIPDLLDVGTLRLWIPGVLLGISIVGARRFIGSSWVTPGLLLAAVALFWAATLAFGSRDMAEAGGWLLGPFPSAPRWLPLIPSELGSVDWGAVLAQWGGITTAGLVALVALLFNVSSLEILNERELEADRELKAAGGANLVTALAGGPVGFHSVTLSLLSNASGGPDRVGAMTAATVCIGVGLFGGGLVEFIPRLMLGGLLLSFGIGLLFDWLFAFRSRLPTAEYLVVVIIVAVVVVAGFLEGVAVGIAAAAGLFAFTYSRADAVRHRLTGAEYSSRVMRPQEHSILLREGGHQTTILELQGFIFFGSSYQILETVRARLADHDQGPARFVVLDFRRVRGIDSSAVLGFVKLQRLVKPSGCTLVLTSVASEVATHLQQGGFDMTPSSVVVKPDLDHGMEWCEEQLLGLAEVDQAGTPSVPISVFEGWLVSDADRERLTPYVERVELTAGDFLITQGDPPGAMYLVVAGSLDTQLKVAENTAMRVARIGPGSIVGEVGLYTGQHRTASVVALTDVAVDSISAEALLAMERDEPDLASTMHRSIAAVLSSRLSRSNDAVRALLD